MLPTFTGRRVIWVLVALQLSRVATIDLIYLRLTFSHTVRRRLVNEYDFRTIFGLLCSRRLARALEQEADSNVCKKTQVYNPNHAWAMNKREWSQKKILLQVLYRKKNIPFYLKFVSQASIVRVNFTIENYPLCFGWISTQCCLSSHMLESSAFCFWVLIIGMLR